MVNENKELKTKRVTDTSPESHERVTRDINANEYEGKVEELEKEMVSQIYNLYLLAIRLDQLRHEDENLQRKYHLRRRAFARGIRTDVMCKKLEEWLNAIRDKQRRL